MSEEPMVSLTRGIIAGEPPARNVQVTVYNDHCTKCGEWLYRPVRDALAELEPEGYKTLFEFHCPKCGKVYSADCWVEEIIVSLAEVPSPSLEPEPIYDCTTGRAIPGHPGLA